MNVVSGKIDCFESLNADDWAKLLKSYQSPDNLRALFELLITLFLYAGFWAVMYAALQISYFLSLIIAIPTAGMLMRIFMIQHDCGHGSFLGSSFVNNWLGRLLGILTFTPFDYWQRNHALHHASSGNLDHRGIGDINTLTVEEYKKRSYKGRMLYRAYRNPLVMFLIGPAYVFLLEQRLPIGMMNMGWRPWVSAMGTNVGIVLLASIMIWLIGWESFLLIQLPVTLLAASMGVWLFFVQHQFEETSWDKKPEWNRKESALHGSSHYDLPQPLRWITGNIGIHHVHHLSSHIPFYRLAEVLRDFPQLHHIGRITLLESFKCAKLALWDTDSRRLL
ncbi:MAG: fatty acid desaturase, partial [Pseudomonadota bacterium]